VAFGISGKEKIGFLNPGQNSGESKIRIPKTGAIRGREVSSGHGLMRIWSLAKEGLAMDFNNELKSRY